MGSPYDIELWPYPLSYNLQAEWDMAYGLSPEQATSQATARWYALYMDAQQARRLSSALAQGASVIYPEDELEVLEPWLKARIMSSFCIAVADCIESSDDVRAALEKLLRELGLATGTIEEKPDGSAGLLGKVDCADDDIYGACEALVDYVEQSARDLLEIAEANTDRALLIARVVDYIPVLGDMPVADDLNDLVDWMAEQGISLFNAGYTQDVRQDLICSLYCLAQPPSCNLTAQDVVGVYLRVGGLEFSADNTFELIVRGVTGTLVGTAFAMSVCTLILGAMSIDGEAGGLVGLQSIENILAAGDPDSDHSVFCTECPDWRINHDFRVGEQPAAQRGWTPRVVPPAEADFIESEGWAPLGNIDNIQFERVLTGDTTTTVDKLVVYVDGAFDAVTVRQPDDGGADFDQTINTSTSPVEFTGLDGASAGLIVKVSSANTDSRAYRIVSEGDGTRPFA